MQYSSWGLKSGREGEITLLNLLATFLLVQPKTRLASWAMKFIIDLKHIFIIFVLYKIIYIFLNNPLYPQSHYSLHLFLLLILELTLSLLKATQEALFLTFNNHNSIYIFLQKASDCVVLFWTPYTALPVPLIQLFKFHPSFVLIKSLGFSFGKDRSYDAVLLAREHVGSTKHAWRSSGQRAKPSGRTMSHRALLALDQTPDP